MQRECPICGRYYGANGCPVHGFSITISGDGSVTPYQPLERKNTPVCIVTRPSDQEIADTTDVTIDFTSGATIEANVGNFFDTASSDKITIGEDGFYSVVGYVLWEIVSGGTRKLWLYKDTTIIAGTTVAVTSTQYYQNVAYIGKLEEGDVIKMIVRQNSGSPVNILDDDSSPRLAVAYLRNMITYG